MKGSNSEKWNTMNRAGFERIEDEHCDRPEEGSPERLRG